MRARLDRRGFLRAMGLGAAAMAIAPRRSTGDTAVAERPNFVIIFTDDQGYQDLGCFGSPQIRTPRIDRMATEGRRFTSFYTQPICGPARTAIMTGCYPLRVGEQGNVKNTHPVVHAKEITVAEVLKARGYATAMIGKWDMARHSQTRFHPDLMPNGQGFDFFFGTPTSNDSIANLYRNGELIERKADMSTLTRRYTDEAIGFIRRSKDRPLFVYLAHTMPHTRLAASEQFRGKSRRGLYGDVIEEIDWNVGRILDAIEQHALTKRTYVIFTSDNGPWLIKRAHGGSALPLRSGKASTWEGGQRVPCVMWAPGRIPAGTVCDEVASTLDVLPTLAKLAGTAPPADRVIDGHDISALMHGEAGATSPTEAYYYYLYTHLQAVRSGKWKLHLPRPARPPWVGNLHWRHIDAKDVFEITHPLLYDLDADVGETTDVAARHPEVIARLLKLAEKAREDIGDYNRIGKGARFHDPGPKRPDMNKWNKPPPKRGKRKAKRSASGKGE